MSWFFKQLSTLRQVQKEGINTFLPSTLDSRKHLTHLTIKHEGNGPYNPHGSVMTDVLPSMLAFKEDVKVEGSFKKALAKYNMMNTVYPGT